MGDLWERRWLRRHDIVAPFGIFAATLLLTYWTEHGQWQLPASLDPAARMVDLAAVLYAMVAVVTERGARLMFWALDERRKWGEKAREEGCAKGLAEGQTATAQHYERWLAKVAEEKGIPLADLLPPRENQ